MLLEIDCKMHKNTIENHHLFSTFPPKYTNKFHKWRLTIVPKDVGRDLLLFFLGLCDTICALFACAYSPDYVESDSSANLSCLYCPEKLEFTHSLGKIKQLKWKFVFLFLWWHNIAFLVLVSHVHLIVEKKDIKQ